VYSEGGDHHALKLLYCSHYFLLQEFIFMFTGIVQGTAELVALTPDQDMLRYQVQFPDGALSEVTLGASIALDGVCLTVTEFTDTRASFDVMQVTRELTTLGQKQPGDRLNFERAMRANAEIGGHLLSGHVAGLSQLVDITPLGHGRVLTFEVPPGLGTYLFRKGYIGINGASLTLVEVSATEFEVSLIPETLRLTTFESLAIGDSVNIEIDSQTQTIVDTVTRFMAEQSTR
jgi:riboflavin synthase